MNLRRVCLVVVMLLAADFTAAQPAAPGHNSPFDGTWEGTMNGLPGLKITIADAGGGEIGGVAVFYFQLRGEDGKWLVAGEFSAPLLMAKMKGNSLLFQVQHHRTHDSPGFGPNRRFRLELDGSNAAMLYNDDGYEGPSYPLERRATETDSREPHFVKASPSLEKSLARAFGAAAQ